MHSAYCKTCGWEGPSRDTETAADNDGADHAVAASSGEPTTVHHEIGVRSGINGPERLRRIDGKRNITARAIDVITSVSQRRLASAQPGDKVCVPATVMQKLIETIEEHYPGAILEARRLLGE